MIYYKFIALYLKQSMSINFTPKVYSVLYYIWKNNVLSLKIDLRNG